MTIGEFKQWLIDNNVPDDAEILIGMDSDKVKEVIHLEYSNTIEII